MNKTMACLLLGCAAFTSTAWAAVHTVSDFSAIGGMSTNAVVCVVGDTIVLPELEEGQSYTNNNPRVLSLSGRVLTALEPGFSGIYDPQANVGGVIVRPQPAGSGRVFVAVVDTTDSLGIENRYDIRNFYWKSAESWLCVSGEGDYPDGADDVALFPFGVMTGYATYDQAFYDISLATGNESSEITVGEIYFGTYNTCKMNCHLNGGGISSTLKFSRTDAMPPRIVFTGGSAANDEAWLRFKSEQLTIDLAQGLTVDLGYGDSGLPVPHVYFDNGTLSLPAGQTMVFVNGQPKHSGSNGTDSGVLFSTAYDLNGQGVIRNDSDMNLRVDSEGDAIFTGTWESGGRRGKTIGSATVGAGIDFRKATAEGCSVISDGAFSINPQWKAHNADYFQFLGSGGVKIGSTKNSHASGTGIGFYPDRIRTASHVTLNSGLLGIWPEYNQYSNLWGSVTITTRVDKLTLGYGVNMLYFWGAGALEGQGTSNFVDIVSVKQQNRAQAYVFSSEFWDAAETDDINSAKVRSRIQGASNLATNGVIPWMGIIARKKGLLPGLVDEDGFLYTKARVNGVMLRNAEPGGNALVHAASLSLLSDFTVNSLSVGSTYNKDRFLGAGRTLTITSGAMYLWDENTVVGVEGGSNNGKIVFDAPAYIHTIVSTNAPAQINLSLVAQYGAAFGAPGGLRITGDQTGIEEELAVNGCRLVFGSEETAAAFDVDIRVAGGYSVLDVQNVNTDFLRKHKLTLQDSGNYPARVNLASGERYRVGELVIGGKTMKAGIYGSSDSDAAIVDDIHFSGTGTLEVLGPGLILIVR